MGAQLDVLKQHLIDPEVCIRCNTCEETCPVHAITHDSANYVVNPDSCNFCMACISPCPTGSIDNWRNVPKRDAYSVEEQYTWGELPPQKSLGTMAEPATSVSDSASATPPPRGEAIVDGTTSRPAATDDTGGEASGIEVDQVRGSTLPPWSAARPYVNLYTHKAPVTATCAGNYRLTAEGIDNDVRHIVLDFGQMPFPVLEGQSIAVLPPGETAAGRAHHARQYSIASARDGERRGYNNLSLTVKRVLPSGTPGVSDGGAGVCSNYLCDLKKGDQVQVLGPYGASFLMPNHPGSHLLMICTGTGSAPMRAMTEYRRRRRAPGKGGATGKLMLFFGARTKEELPYFGPLMSLPKDFIDVNLAFSRTPGQPKTYVQDVMRKRAADIASMLRDENTYIYVCGLKGMEEGVIQVLGEIANDSAQPWEPLWKKLKDMGRLHFETY